jgi:hypothetical protein
MKLLSQADGLHFKRVVVQDGTDRRDFMIYPGGSITEQRTQWTGGRPKIIRESFYNHGGTSPSAEEILSLLEGQDIEKHMGQQPSSAPRASTRL